MAIATWEDFNSKWGFHEGSSLKSRDFEARALLVDSLNNHPEMQKAQIRAVEWNRPGLHNSCLVLILPNPACKSDGELREAWLMSDLEEVPVPADVGACIGELIAKAYECLKTATA